MNETTTTEASAETWDQRRERETKEKVARCKEFAEKIEQAFALCGLEVFGISDDDNDGFSDRRKATLPKTSKSAYLSASIDRYGYKGRILVGLWYADQLSARDVWGYNAQHIEITVADSKTADQIAGDIKRRILPSLEESIKKADALLKSRTDYAALTARNVKLLGGDPNWRKQHTNEVNRTVDFDGGSATVSGDDVRLDLYSVKAETAKKIIDLLKKI